MSSKNYKDLLSEFDNVKSVQRHEFDLLNRPSWANATVAYRNIKRGKAAGNLLSLWVRSQLQNHLYEIGYAIQKNSGKLLILGTLFLASFCLGLQQIKVEHNLERLWVEEGGRVTRELDYIQAKLEASPAMFSDQVIIQTPAADANQNILRPENLLSHVRMLELALQVEVELYDYAWSLEDICVKPSVPSTGLYYVDDVFERLMPCIIMTPLDCFWEGSKLLNRRNVPYVVIGNETQYLRWTHLNPVEKLVAARSQFNDTDFSFDLMQKYMKRAGIGNGYMERPCLNPRDPDCPKSAPNKLKAAPTSSFIGATLTGGCNGIASNFMHWHEDLILGGVVKNRSGVIVKAEALQSVVRIMDDKEMYAHHLDSHNQVSSDWTLDRAREVIVAWQKKFTEQLKTKAQKDEKRQEFNLFTFNALQDVIKSFSRPSVARVVIGVAVVTVYVCAVLVNLQKPELSQAFVGLLGILLMGLSLASGYGLCSMLGLKVNVSSTQVLPFLAIGLGTNGIFLLTHTMNRIISSGVVPLEEQTGECLKRSGVNIILSNSSMILAFFAASLIPIPALRTFSLQAAILLTFALFAVIVLFPSVISLDLQRRASRRLDLLCCLKAAEPRCEQRNRRSSSSSDLVTGQPIRVREEGFVKPTVSVISIDDNDENELRLKRQRGLDDGCFGGFSLSSFAADYYAPFIQHPAIRTIAVVSFVMLVGFGIYGALRIEDGLQLSDFIPKQSLEYEYIIKQEKYFKFYSIFAVTQANFEYPANQRLLHEFHSAFGRVENIVKNDDGGLTEFWLSLFRDWLLGLQKTFDDEFRQGLLTTEGWTANATTDAVLAFKLLVQTGRSDNPINKSQILTNRLVDRDGIIDKKAFYNYLTAWYNNDPLAYQASQAQISPQPPHWDMVARSNELRIKKSSAIQYTQLPYYLHNINSTKEITSVISQLRAISERFELRGLPNFPTGLPIIYWEQYLTLRFYVSLAIGVILLTVFMVISSVLLNFAAAMTITLVLAGSVCQMLGVLHLLHITLSAVPAVLIIMSVGMGVDFTLHLVMGYLTALGSKTRRVNLALEYMFAPMVHSVITTLLGIAMLGFSEFEFVIRHFFFLLSATVLIYSYSGFVVLPVLLNLLGPQADLIPHKNPNTIDPPTPRSSPVFSSRKSSRRKAPLEATSQSYSSRSRRAALAARSDFSLSTITEEPSTYQCSSPEPEPTKIVVHPEFTVQTTTTTTNTNSGIVFGSTSSASTTGATSSPSPMPSSASSGIDSESDTPSVTTTTDVGPGGSNVTTKVTTTTTAKLKLEVLAPSSYKHEHCCSGRMPTSRGQQRFAPDSRSFSDFSESRDYR